MRPETGPMKFDGDWRGVFIRGDNAFNYANHLERLLKHQPPDDVVGMMVIRELYGLLVASNELAPNDLTQHMRPFAEAVANHETVEQLRRVTAIIETADRDPDDCVPCLDHGQAPERGEGP